MWTQSKIRGSLQELAAPPERTLKAVENPAAPHGRGRRLVLNAAAVLILWLLVTSVLKYLTVSPDTYGIYWPKREWLLAHIIGGTLALVLGPLQFRTGWNRRQPALHRTLGVAYVISVAVGTVSAIQLALLTDFGWVFGMGLASMAFAWVVTTGLAVVAIRRRRIEQHREWILRSYVVTFGFVTFRLLLMTLEMVNTGTLTEQMTAASWLCWSIPLLITEAVLQGRKIIQ
jgi:uncharacterized membrane protein